MHSSFAKLAIVLAGAMYFALATTAQNSDWQVLKTVSPGQRIRIALRDGKTRDAKLQSADDSALTIDRGQILNKNDVRRVLLKRKGHRGKHALIGAGIGGGTGLGLGTAVDAQCSHESIFCTGPYGKIVFTPLFGAIGAGVGAVLPAHGGWQEIYRAE